MRPEVVERRHREIKSCRPLVVHVREPFPRAAALGELLAEPERIGQCRECGVVVAGLRVRLGQPRHGHQQRVVAGAGVVVALVSGGGRHDDVGVLGHRRPVRVVYDDRVDTAERAAQPRNVLVMMQRIAAGPVHQLDVGVRQAAAVVVERFAGMQQHVADRRDRDERLHRIRALRQLRQTEAQRWQSRLVHRAVAMPETASGKPDLAQHRRQGQAHPRCLLAVPDPLQRPADCHDRAPRRHPSRQCDQIVGGQAADLRCPLRRLRDAVVKTEQVALEAVVAGAVACSGNPGRPAIRWPARGPAPT